MIESTSLKKLLTRDQLSDLTAETQFLRILGPPSLTQVLLGPNSCMFLISGIRPILLAIKTNMLRYLSAPAILQSNIIPFLHFKIETP